MTLLEKANKSNGLLQLKLNGHQLNTVVNSGNAVNRVKSVIANLQQQQQPIQAAIQPPVLRSSNNSVTTNPSINTTTVPITTAIAPSFVAASSSSAHRSHQPPRSLASFMANRCCVCSRLLRNYRGNRLAKSYEITIDPNDLLSSRSHNHHHSNESVRGHLNGDASTLVNNNSNNTNRSNHRISRLLTKHLALSSAAPAKNSSQNGGDSSDSVSQKRKLCQSCYDHLNQIDGHMKSVIRLRNLMKAKLRKSLRLVSSGNKPVLNILRRHRHRGGNNNNGFVKLVADSSDLIVKSENNINNRVGSAASNRSASNKMNLSKQLMINAAANSNNDAGLASSAQASSSSISSSPSATSLSPATNSVYSSHLNQNGALAGLYVQPQTEQFLRLNPDILALLAATGSLSNNSNNASFELASLANMDLKPTLISPPSSSSNRRKRKSQNPSRLLNKGDSMTFNLDENNNNQLQPNNNQALNLAKLVAATTTAQVKSKLANMAKQQQQQQQQLKAKTTKTTINITDNQAGRSIGNKLRSSLAAANALSHFIPTNKENDAHGNKRRSLQVKSDLDDELDDEQMINDEELHQVDEIKNNDQDDQEENNELGDEDPIDETCGVQDEDPDMNGGDNSQYDDPMYDEEEDEEDDEAHHHQMNGFDEEDDEENNNNSNNDELGGAYGAEEGDDEEEDEEEDHSLAGGGSSSGLLRSQGRGLSTSTSTTTLTHHNNIPIKHLFEAAHNAAQQRVKLNNQVRNNNVGLKSKKFSLTNGDMEGSNTNQVANVLLSMSGSKSSSSANNIHHNSNSNNNNDPEFKHNCNICRKSFKTQNILRQHMRIHTGDKPFVCDLCNKAFSQMASLKYHQATHSDDRPYKCDGCAKTFKLKPPFKKHIKDCPQRMAILGANPGSTSSNNNAALISLLNASGLAGLVDHDDDNDDDIND